MVLYRLSDETHHPKSPDAVGEDEIPTWILIENQAYVANRRNSTTAYSDGRCDSQVQATLVVAPPPRVSYICVFCPGPGGGGGEDEGQMIPIEPSIIATDEDLVLLHIAISDGKDERFSSSAFDFFVYQPAGDGGPKLTRVESPAYLFNCYQLGLVSCTANRRDDHDGLSLPRPRGDDNNNGSSGGFKLAALCQDIYDRSALEHGRFILHLYNSELRTWTAINVSLSEEHYQKYKNQQGYFIHLNTKVIVIGGEDATIAFVDLYRGILLCDLARVQDQPWLRYVPLPNPPLPYRQSAMGDPRLSRDIAVVKGHFKYVLECRLYDDGWVVGWSAYMFSRRVSDCSLSDDSWDSVFQVESPRMDTKGSLNFHLLPEIDLDGMPFSPLNDLHTLQPTISLDTDNTVCFMAKLGIYDAKAWVLSVDMESNRLREVAEFDATRYFTLGFAYLHSRISKYMKMAQGTKENLKRQGILLQGSRDKKQAWGAEMVGMAEGKDDGSARLMG